MGTSVKKDSYRLRFREVCYGGKLDRFLREGRPTSSRMVRNETLSNAHKVQGVTEIIDAARGALHLLSSTLTVFPPDSLVHQRQFSK
jgi:hypothetical protein